MNKKIEQKILRQLLDYSPETGVLIWRKRSNEFFKKDVDARRWNAKNAGKEAFTFSDERGQKAGAIFGKTFSAHRVIWAWMTGRWPAQEIDHINGNPSDNRWVNLRAVTHQENCQNRSIRADNKSGVQGVRKKQSTGRWIAYISVKGKAKHIGSFKCKTAAVFARMKAETDFKYHPNHGRRTA
jgi:hypothetical protein